MGLRKLRCDGAADSTARARHNRSLLHQNRPALPRHNVDRVSEGMRTRCPAVTTSAPAPAAAPAPAPIAAPLPPPAIPPMIAPSAAVPPATFAVRAPRDELSW